MKKLQSRDVAKVLDLTADMVRKMETAGIIKAEKTVSGTRIYDAKEVERVARERAAKKKR